MKREYADTERADEALRTKSAQNHNRGNYTRRTNHKGKGQPKEKMQAADRKLHKRNSGNLT